ncbi:transporter substrate-binding domain-containing protein [uncultured Flavonifractor sp.]|uniref:transporter substrate-binding domain-containing protein n=1 Tax=uncultured Flavonifractor sp. TaxID=1193534 RepID=UPI002607CF3A|nr:transporter substrate-binding domain-containing protein [uncultured Flavonifractor sp.]
MAPAAQAASNGNTVVRVGFPIQHGISYLDENGDYSGYMVDYLEYLSLYTNWDYEFVTVEGDTNTQINTLMQMLMDGEIDMMGTMNWSIPNSV